MSRTPPTLDEVTRDYADALRRLLKTLRQAQVDFQEVTEHSGELHATLARVGGELRLLPPTEGIEHALAMLAWVLRTGQDTKLLIHAAIGTHAQVLPRLSILQNVASDLSAAVAAASSSENPRPATQSVG